MKSLNRTPLLIALLLSFVIAEVSNSQSPVPSETEAGQPIPPLNSSLDSLLRAVRRSEAMHFHSMAHQGDGLLIPLYQYPADIHTNAAFNRVMESQRRFRTIPFWVILNPGTGPGQIVDANYTKAVDRLLCDAR